MIHKVRSPSAVILISALMEDFVPNSNAWSELF